VTLERGEEEEGGEEGAPGVRALGPRASASAVSPLPAATVAAMVKIWMDKTRLHRRPAEQHRARGPDLHSEEGDLRGRSVFRSPNMDSSLLLIFHWDERISLAYFLSGFCTRRRGFFGLFFF